MARVQAVPCRYATFHLKSVGEQEEAAEGTRAVEPFRVLLTEVFIEVFPLRAIQNLIDELLRVAKPFVSQRRNHCCDQFL